MATLGYVIFSPLSEDIMLRSFGIPKALLFEHGEYSSSRISLDMLREDMIRRSKAEIMRSIDNMLTRHMGELDLSTICTSEPKAHQDVSVKKLLEIAKKCPSPRLKLQGNVFMGGSKQFRFPKTKKRRIRRKWAKRPENYRFVPDSTYYIIGDTLVAHPATIEKLKRALPAVEGDENDFFAYTYPIPLTAAESPNENPTGTH